MLPILLESKRKSLAATEKSNCTLAAALTSRLLIGAVQLVLEDDFQGLTIQRQEMLTSALFFAYC